MLVCPLDIWCLYILPIYIYIYTNIKQISFCLQKGILLHKIFPNFSPKNGILLRMEVILSRFFILSLCMHACMHAYIHTYINACMHAYIHTYIHICIHIYLHIMYNSVYVYVSDHTC